MTQSEKIKHLLEDLGNRGVSQYTVAPPVYQLLWRLGWQVRPPLFQSFIALFLGMGTFFGVFFGLLMWIVLWGSMRLGAGVAVMESAMAGALFGLAMATYYRWKARSLGLPKWERYPDA